MNAIPPLETLYDDGHGDEITLPAELAAAYGRIAFPAPTAPPYVISNFVTSLDGVVSLGIPGQAGGGPISGFNTHDRMVMGLLRAFADAVVVGAGTLRSVPAHLWTADYACPMFAEAYDALRASLGKSGPPLNVIVTARGDIDPAAPVFKSGKVPALIVTNEQGLGRIRALGLPLTVDLLGLAGSGRLSARAILQAISERRTMRLVLVEGGPRLLADFFADSCIDEQFLTLSPQIAGRGEADVRPGLVVGRTFAPERPLWATLVSIKRGADHLFLRYRFTTGGHHVR